MPVRESFWQQYRARLALCAAVFFVGTFLIASAGWLTSAGTTIIVGILFSVFGVLPAAIMPVYWYLSFRGLHERFQEESPEENGPEEETSEPESSEPAASDTAGESERVAFDFDGEEQDAGRVETLEREPETVDRSQKRHEVS